MLRNDIDQPIAVVQRAAIIRHDYAVPITIQRNADICIMLPYSSRQCDAVGRATVMVDIEAVGLHSNGNHIRSEFVEYMARDLICRAVRTVNDNTQPPEIEMIGESTLAKFDVAAPGIIDAPRF